jgi:hypothetical protein
MAIHTSAITYRRGIPNNYNNFFFVTQANNSIPAPMHLYMQHYRPYNRNVVNPTKYRWPWNN